MPDGSLAAIESADLLLFTGDATGTLAADEGTDFALFIGEQMLPAITGSLIAGETADQCTVTTAQYPIIARFVTQWPTPPSPPKWPF